MIKTLVVTSCTGEKWANPANKLLIQDFMDENILHEREKELVQFSRPASEMYTGEQHKFLMDGIVNLRKHFGSGMIDVAIVSAGYGLLKEHTKIVPYEVTFNGMEELKIIEWSRHLKINENLNEIIKNYDLIFFLLGYDYLRAIELPLHNIDESKRLVYFASPTSAKLIPYMKPLYNYIKTSQEDAKSFGCGNIGLKGYLFKLLLQEMIDNNNLEILERIYEKPRYIYELLNKHRKNENGKRDFVEQIGPFEGLANSMVIKSEKKRKKEPDICIITDTDNRCAKNYMKFPMQFFMPECDDRVDPNYDFINDFSDKDRGAYESDVYAHEIYSPHSYDGILVSKISVEANKKKKEMMKKLGVHNYIRYPKGKLVMGDCGAFSYIDKEKPPYKTEEILEYYESIGVDIGVSIDHLIIGKINKDEVERERRYKITQENALDFITKYNEKKDRYHFKPSGIAQGWDPNSYKRSVKALIDMGYEHISIGGLAKAKTIEIIPILKEIAPIIEKDTEVHLFGAARLDAIDEFRRLGITSFDSSSYLRRAWTDDKKNYFTLDGNFYSAIRIPQSHGKTIKEHIKSSINTFEQCEELERKSLDAMRKYDKNEMDIEETLDILLNYTELTGKSGWEHEERYRRTLEDMPWKKCDCKICKEVGVETIIFRGNNRNRRRGFHNTYVFYKLFKEGLNK